MSYDPAILSLGKKPREIVTRALKGTSSRMCITEDVHYTIICVMGSWRLFSKEIKCRGCVQRNTMQQSEANLPIPKSDMNISLKQCCIF